MENMSLSESSGNSSPSKEPQARFIGFEFVVPQNTPISSPRGSIQLLSIEGITEASFKNSKSLMDQSDYLGFEDFESNEISANSTTIYESDSTGSSGGPAKLKRTSTPENVSVRANSSNCMDIDSSGKQSGNDGSKNSLGSDTFSANEDIEPLRCEQCGADLLNSACAISGDENESTPDLMLCFNCMCNV